MISPASLPESDLSIDSFYPLGPKRPSAMQANPIAAMMFMRLKMRLASSFFCWASFRIPTNAITIAMKTAMNPIGNNSTKNTLFPHFLIVYGVFSYRCLCHCTMNLQGEPFSKPSKYQRPQTVQESRLQFGLFRHSLCKKLLRYLDIGHA